MRRPHLVPLSTQALNLLHELKSMTGNYCYASPGRNDPNKPMSEASTNQLIKQLGYGGRLIGHGFRHMISTILHDAGFNSQYIELQFIHVDSNRIRGTYNHANIIEERREMLGFFSSTLFLRGI